MNPETHIVDMKPEGQSVILVRDVFSSGTAETSSGREFRELVETFSAPTAGDAAGLGGTVKKQTVPLSTLYPHLEDESSEAGRVRSLVSDALAASEAATDARDHGATEAFSQHLGLLALQLRAASDSAENSVLSSVLSFLKRSVIAADPSSISQQGWNALIVALRSLRANPFLDLEEAADLAAELEDHGWRGSSEVIEGLVSAFLEREESTAGAPAMGETL